MRHVPLLVTAFSLLLSVTLPAAPAAAQVLQGDEALYTQSTGFLANHPDLKFRKRGLQAYFRGRTAEAAEHFLDAARFADKPSMAMLAEMYWTGTGVPQDRARAYAWADLAAERGYPDLVGLRESYWRQIDPATRRHAIEVGLPLLREYGDAVAQPRMNRQLALARRQITGSRVGHVGSLTVRFLAKEFTGAAEFDGQRFHADKFYEPEQYYAWQATTWQQRGDEQGSVDLGEVQPSDPSTSD